MLGGRLKLCVSGGGPLSPDIQNFIRVAFRVNLVQGYGLTETCAAGSVQPFWYLELIVVLQISTPFSGLLKTQLSALQ